MYRYVIVFDSTRYKDTGAVFVRKTLPFHQAINQAPTGPRKN